MLRDCSCPLIEYDVCWFQGYQLRRYCWSLRTNLNHSKYFKGEGVYPFTVTFWHAQFNSLTRGTCIYRPILALRADRLGVILLSSTGLSNGCSSGCEDIYSSNGPNALQFSWPSAWTQGSNLKANPNGDQHKDDYPRSRVDVVQVERGRAAAAPVTQHINTSVMTFMSW